MSRSAGLGRGLASLIPDSAFDEEEGPGGVRQSFRTVPLDEVKPNPEQPREVFDSEGLAELSDSIRQYGIMSPLVVRRHEGRYVIISGERRFRAAALAGLTEVPVVVREAEAPEEQLELALVENLQRVDLDPIEAAKGFQRLIEIYGYTQEEVAERVGKDRSTVANGIRLLKLPEFVLDVLREGHIAAGHARTMLPLVGHDGLKAVLAKVVSDGLSVRATERLVKQVLNKKSSRGKQKQKTLSYANKLLTDALHTSVTIRPRKRGGGRIIIDYADAEDLERLITQIREGKKRRK